MAETIRLDRNPTLIESFGQGLQPALRGMVSMAQNRALGDFASEQGFDFPMGLNPQFAQQFLINQVRTGGGAGGAFSLSPGATRFDAQGNPIASVPSTERQQPFTLTPGATRFGPGGQPLASVPGLPATPRAPTNFEQKQKMIDFLSAIPKEERTAAQQDRLDDLLGREPPPKPTAREKEIDRIQKALTTLNAKEKLTSKEQKKKQFLERRSQSALYGDVKSTPKEELQAQGYDAEAAQRILDIKNGLEPRASSRTQFDNMGLVEKSKYLATERQKAEGQYFGVEGGNIDPRQPEYLQWVLKEQAKVQQGLNQKQAGPKPAAYPDAVWSEEHEMWTIEKDGRTWGIE